MITLAEDFADYLQRETGFTVAAAETPPVRLPQYLRGQFVPQVFHIGGQRCVALMLDRDARFASASALEKQVAKVLALLGEEQADCCLVAEDLDSYLRRRLMKSGLPFVVVDEQIYLPFLGTLMTRQRRRRRATAPPAEALGPAAQAVLIALLLKHIPTPVTATELAKHLGYTAMSMGRALRTLEAENYLTITEQGRARRFGLADEPRALWDYAQPKLRSPVRETVRILQKELPEGALPKAGESALAEATMLVAPFEPVFAVASARWRKLGRNIERIPIQDEGTCQLELWRYPPDILARQGCVDPLSLALSLREHPDERVQDAVEELIEDLPW